MKKSELMSWRLKTLEQSFQNLQDQAYELPEASEALAPALQEVALAIMRLRASQKGWMSPATDSPGGQADSLWQPKANLVRSESMLRQVFSTITDVFTVLDRELNIISTSWPGYKELKQTAHFGQIKCYQAFHGLERPCKECHVAQVLATGQPLVVEKLNVLDNRIYETTAIPILDESGQVIQVAENWRDITALRQVEESLSEREDLYRMLTENSLAGVYLVHNEKFRYANVKMAQLFGYAPEEIIDRLSPYDLIYPEDHPLLEEQIRRRMSGEAEEAHFTARGVRKDGNVIYLEFLGRRVEYKGRPAIVGTLLDITAQKEAEEALEFQAQLLDVARDAIVAHDLEGNIVYANETAAQCRGYTKEELLKKTIYDLVVSGEPRQASLQRMSALQAEKTFDSFESYHVRKDGTKFPIEVHGRLTQINGKKIFLGVARDITDRKRAEAALRESEERYRTLFETAPYGMCMMDLQMNIIMRNQEGIRLFELDVEGDQPRNGLNYLAPEDRERIMATFANLLETGQVRSLEVNLLRKDGTRLPCLISASLIRDAAGQPQSIIGVAQDITELQRAKDALGNHLQFMRVLIDAIPNPIFYKDAQGAYLGCNTAFGELMGVTPEDIVGKTVYDIHPQELADKYRQMDLAVLQSQGSQIYEWAIQGADGSIHHVVIHKATFPDPEGRVAGLVGNIVDISDLKRAEEAVRESEVRLRAIFEHAPVGISMADQQGRILQANPAFQQIVGYSMAELQNMTFQQITHPDDLPGNLLLQDELLAGKRQHYAIEKRYIRKDGEIVWINTMLSRVLSAQGEPRGLAIAQDITARKQAEQALQESEQRFRDITENSAEWVWEVDTQGQYTYSSPVVEQLLGYKPNEVIGKYYFDFFSPDVRDEQKAVARKVLELKQPFKDFLNKNVHKDGQIILLSTTGMPIWDEQGRFKGYRGADIDITARKQAEEALRESEQRFRLMAETIQDVLWIRAPRLDKVVYVSPAYEKVWGRSSEELFRAPQSFLEAIHPEDQQEAEASMLAHQRRGLEFSQEYRVLWPDGSVRWVHDHGFPVKDDLGQVILYTGVAKDITERKTLEQQLLLAQKMEAVGRLAGGVAHDFNNLLMAIASYAELIRGKILKDTPLYSYLEDILKATDRATALTGQLLTFSRQQIIHPRVVNLNQQARDLKRLLRRLIAEDIELEVITAPDLGMVKADPGYLNQIVMNLVINARDAMPCGGYITLETDEIVLEEGRRTRSGVAPPGPYVVLKVSDTGIGMDESIQAHIFEPFFTTKEPGKGTGLGLSIVYGIIKQSGGFIDLDSTPGQGSTFTLYLPRLETGAEPAKTGVTKQRKFRGEETILLVEDEDLLRTLLAKFMRLNGYTVLEARHGDEALQICTEYQGPIQLMVTDVVMPQMSGRVLADRIRILRPEMKVLYMSGYTEDEVVQRGVADLSMSFLQKPFKPVDLARQVRMVLKGKNFLRTD